MSKYSVLGCYGEGNLGDEAILAGLKRLIRLSDEEALFTIYIGTESFATAYAEQTVLDHNLVKLKNWYGLFIKGKIFDIIKAMIKTDVLVIGGGELIRDDFGIMPLLAITEKALMAKLFGNKLALLGIGVGKLDTTMGRLLTKMLINFSETVIVRDQGSQAILQELAPTRKISVARDVAFTLPSVRSIDLPGSSRIIAVSIRDWPSAWSSKTITKQDQTLLYKTFINELATVLKSLETQHAYSFVFIPFRIVEGDDDREALHEVIKLSGVLNYTMQEYSADPATVKASLAQCDLMIGMRLHACILALSEGIPTLAINYDNKVTKLMTDLALDEFILDIFNADAADFSKKIMDCLSIKREELTSKLLKQVKYTHEVYAHELHKLTR